MWQCTPAFSAWTVLRSPYSSPACSSASVSSTTIELPSSASTPDDTKQPDCIAHKCRCNRQSATPGTCLHCKTAHSICTKLEGPQVHQGAAKVARTHTQDMTFQISCQGYLRGTRRTMRFCRRCVRSSMTSGSAFRLRCRAARAAAPGNCFDGGCCGGSGGIPRLCCAIAPRVLCSQQSSIISAKFQKLEWRR